MNKSDDVKNFFHSAVIFVLSINNMQYNTVNCNTMMPYLLSSEVHIEAKYKLWTEWKR